MYIRTDFWRSTLFTALGFGSYACTGTGDAPTPSWVSECGDSTPKDKQYARYDLETCSGNGLEHRASNRVTCTSELPREENAADAAGRIAEECKSDAECTAKPYGHCSNGTNLGPPFFTCQYGCVSDSDCEAGQLCNCYSPVGMCVASDCTQDSDCGPGMLCAEAFFKGDPCGGASYRCQTPEDECAVSADCPDEERSACYFDGARRVCDEPGPVCGRPFLVEGAALLAPLSASAFGDCGGRVERNRADGGRVDASSLTAKTRETLGQYWAQIGLMEHASIAAFARFALQLMHVGAPLALLSAAQQAMLDETAHAKACFGIASALCGRSVGPGKLPLENALAETSLEDIVRLTVREGCIGETIAAIEAAEARATTQDPHIRAVLGQIEADELRHAELAWRFVQWALTEDAARPNPTALRSLHDVVREEVSAALAELVSNRDVAVAKSESERVSAAYGVLPAATRAAVRRSALEGVVAPCAAELLRVTAIPMLEEAAVGALTV